MQRRVPDLNRRIARFHQEMVGFFRRRVPGDPEEAAQEVWLRVAKADPECPDDAAFRAYAYTVARRLVVDLHRRRAARVELVAMDEDRPDPVDPGAARPGDALDAREVAQVVERELQDMKPEIAQVFRWRAEEDVPFKEIAERHGCSINTALGRMHRATLKVAAALRAAGLWEVNDA